MEYKRCERFAFGGNKITITEVKEIIKLGAETILANDNSYEAKYLVEQLMNFYSFLDSQKGSSDYCTLFDNVRFKRYMRSFFPGGRTGIGNYYSSKFNKN